MYLLGKVEDGKKLQIILIYYYPDYGFIFSSGKQHSSVAPSPKNIELYSETNTILDKKYIYGKGEKYYSIHARMYSI